MTSAAAACPSGPAAGPVSVHPRWTFSWRCTLTFRKVQLVSAAPLFKTFRHPNGLREPSFRACLGAACLRGSLA